MKCLKDPTHGNVIESIHTEDAYRCPICGSLFDAKEFKGKIFLKVSRVIHPQVRELLRGKGFIYYVKSGVWIKEVGEAQAKKYAKEIMDKALISGYTQIIIERLKDFDESDYI